MTRFNSAIYSGEVWHKRLTPRVHEFKYKVFMMYLDLDELDDVLKLSPWWSKNPWHLAQFRRSDYFGTEQLSLKAAVKEKVESELDISVDGRICMLSNLRYFGYITNPLTIYYCFDSHSRLTALLLEVTNTPWGRRQQYVLACEPSSSECKKRFSKEMHVSPFNPMDMIYEWSSSAPLKNLNVAMSNWHQETRVFEAYLSLTRSDITSSSLRSIIFQYPFMTLKIISSIYWQALRLWFKNVPFYPNPHSKTVKNK